MKMYHQSGFSLVELSIVLVILGLLVGGVLSGSQLIHAAELRAVGTELQTWQTAVNTFKSKYRALPGDFKKATKVWQGQTENGDGNGSVAIEDENNPDPGQWNEHFLFWQHLALAGLIGGNYTGEAGPVDANHHVIGENCPASRLSGGGWTAETAIDGFPDVRFEYDYKNALLYGAETESETTYAPILTAADAWTIDQKFDDGMPGSGVMLVLNYGECSNATAMDDYDAEYALSNPEVACSAYFREVF